MTEESMPQDDNIKERPSRARYDKVRHGLERKWRRREPKADRMMREVVDSLWDSFQDAPYSWCGFYVLAPDGKSLVLGPCREKPGPSTLAMDSPGGQALASGKSRIEPSRIDVPVFDVKGKAWAVFEATSATDNAFDGMDQRWLEQILKTFQGFED